MVELKPCCVQEMPLWRKRRQTSPSASTVHVITHHGVTDGREMHPDLMRPSGVQVSAKQVGAREARKPAKIRACVLPRTDDCHALPVSWVARDWLVHGQSIGSEMAPGHHGVAPYYAPCGDRRTEPLVRNVAFGNDQESRGLLVQPMHQPRPFRPAALGEVAATPHEGIDQSSGPVTWSRMDDHSGRLVHHEQVGILVDDPERDVLALNVAARRCRFRLGDPDQIVGCRTIRGALADTVDGDVPICD